MSNTILLNEAEAMDYVVNELNFFESNEGLISTEIGDGNLNMVYRIEDSATGKSIILKQAPPFARTSVEMELDADRCRIEALAMIEQKKYANDFVPEVYKYDEELYAMAMEDLKGFRILRSELMNQVELPNLAKQAATFFAQTLIKSSDIVLDSKTKKDQVTKFINKDLCELTENLVLTNSAFAAQRNKIEENVKDFVLNDIFDDASVQLEVAKLKNKFMTKAESLLHGDAHSGSIFVNEEKTIFFDAEFAFYGPMGFDVGMFLGNLIMDYCYHVALSHTDYSTKVLEMVEEFVDTFINEFELTWSEHAKEHFATQSELYKQWYLEETLKDIAGYCGAEMIRRTTGSSHVAEMDDIENVELKRKAQMHNLTMGKFLLLNQEKFVNGKIYKELLEK